MILEMKVPSPGESISEVEIAQWLVEDGDYVDEAELQEAVAVYLEAKQVVEGVIQEEDDRCTKIAKRKYDVWPSAYASGAVVKCRQGKIWKGVSENTDLTLNEGLYFRYLYFRFRYLRGYS